MRFLLKLFAINCPAILPLNYQYPLSAVIYSILHRADMDYAHFLHETGYKQSENSLKAFKFFTFSGISTPFRIQGDRMQLTTPEAELIVTFHLPHAAETFIKGLFINQEIEIADKRSRARFRINQVESIPSGLSRNAIQGLILRPLSPVVCGRKNEKKNYDFLSPDHPEFVPQLMYNWQSKCEVLYKDGEDIFAGAGMEVLFYKDPPKSRLITIKVDTPGETRIRGFVNFRLKVKGKLEALELLINAGSGTYNSLGFGCVTNEKI